MKVKEITPAVHTKNFQKEVLSQNCFIFFLSISLHHHLVGYNRKQTFVEKKITVSFASLNVFKIFHFKHVPRVVQTEKL